MFRPINSSYTTVSISAENIRNQRFSDIFRGYGKRLVAWNGLKPHLQSYSRSFFLHLKHKCHWLFYAFVMLIAVSLSSHNALSVYRLKSFVFHQYVTLFWNFVPVHEISRQAFWSFKLWRSRYLWLLIVKYWFDTYLTYKSRQNIFTFHLKFVLGEAPTFICHFVPPVYVTLSVRYSFCPYVRRTPYLRTCTSCDNNFWFTCVKW